jgi:hypothetical protein
MIKIEIYKVVSNKALENEGGIKKVGGGKNIVVAPTDSTKAAKGDCC